MVEKKFAIIAINSRYMDKQSSTIIQLLKRSAHFKKNTSNQGMYGDSIIIKELNFIN